MANRSIHYEYDIVPASYFQRLDLNEEMSEMSARLKQ